MLSFSEEDQDWSCPLSKGPTYHSTTMWTNLWGKIQADHQNGISLSIHQPTYIHQAGKRDELKHFAIHEDKLPEVVDYVQEVILSRFPSGTDAVPNHSR